MECGLEILYDGLKGVVFMLCIWAIWNYFWWNYHLNHARKHDSRMATLIPDWKDKLFKEAKLKDH